MAPSILSTIMRVESGGKNVPQAIDDINMRRGDPAQGYFQITGGTWRDFGGEKTGRKSAIEAPYAEQLQIAQNIPVERWGPNTQAALKAAGYEPKAGETLGQMLARYNEDPKATRPEDVGGSSEGGTAVAAAPPTPSLLAPSTPIDTTAAMAAAEKLRQEKEAEAEYAALTKTGMGLLEKATPQAPQFAAAPMSWDLPQVKPPPLPNYTQQAQATDPFTQVLMQQRLQRRV